MAGMLRYKRAPLADTSGALRYAPVREGTALQTWYGLGFPVQGQGINNPLPEKPYNPNERQPIYNYGGNLNTGQMLVYGVAATDADGYRIDPFSYGHASSVDGNPLEYSNETPAIGASLMTGASSAAMSPSSHKLKQTVTKASAPKMGASAKPVHPLVKLATTVKKVAAPVVNTVKKAAAPIAKVTKAVVKPVVKPVPKPAVAKPVTVSKPKPAPKPAVVAKKPAPKRKV